MHHRFDLILKTINETFYFVLHTFIMDDLIKPNNDNNIYKIGKLKNNIDDFIIQDNKLTETTISVSINCGSYHDKNYYDGIAHFLKHILFLGTKKYPELNYISKVLSEYNGYANAYTAVDHTVYYCKF